MNKKEAAPQECPKNTVTLEFIEKQPVAEKSNEDFYSIGIIRENKLYIIKMPRDFSKIIPEWSFLQFQEPV